MSSDRSLDQARAHMVETQLRARGIRDAAVLDAMSQVPRHVFVPPALRDRSYDDCALAIGDQQTISQPYIVARMTELLEVHAGDRILEIGGGSGYQAAVLAAMGARVYTIEIDESLALSAHERLMTLGFQNCVVRHGDGRQGWPEQAPFDGALVAAAPVAAPEHLLDQLRPGGPLVVPVGEPGKVQVLWRLRQRGSQIERERILEVRFVPLVGGENA